MKTFFIRSTRPSRIVATPAVNDTSQRIEMRRAAVQQPLEQAMVLDTLTTWPTHRIRSFLSMQTRRER